MTTITSAVVAYEVGYKVTVGTGEYHNIVAVDTPPPMVSPYVAKYEPKNRRKFKRNKRRGL